MAPPQVVTAAAAAAHKMPQRMAQGDTVKLHLIAFCCMYNNLQYNTNNCIANTLILMILDSSANYCDYYGRIVSESSFNNLCSLMEIIIFRRCMWCVTHLYFSFGKYYFVRRAVVLN